MNNENQKRKTGFSLSQLGVGAAALSTTAVVMAAGETGGFGTAASGEITSAKTDVTTVGLAIIGVSALIFVVKLVKRLIGG